MWFFTLGLDKCVLFTFWSQPECGGSNELFELWQMVGGRKKLMNYGEGEGDGKGKGNSDPIQHTNVC